MISMKINICISKVLRCDPLVQGKHEVWLSCMILQQVRHCPLLQHKHLTNTNLLTNIFKAFSYDSGWQPSPKNP